uniref:LisH domain-containing protein n=1 Tax=Trichobilharzia regenti TaxID=157069 RepID=A0AA85JX26_TRIRE|nr:unnamed protein product [Trichobilharzia regenti]
MSRPDKYENVRNVYRLLKEKGDIDKLKSQIRQRIILGFASLENPVPKSDCEIIDENVRLVDCLIADHMKHQGYDYSLSVFLPEIGFTSYESEEHIKNLLFSKSTISRNLWQKIASYHQDTSSFLVSILKAEADISDVLKEQKSVQTCDLDVCELDQRLKDIDKEYEAVKSADILHLKKTFEDRLEYYKREVGEQYQVKLTQQMTEFRQNELNTIKLEMEGRFQERIKEHVMRLEKEFEIRLQSLNDQEELLKEKYNLSEQREEREAFVKRQALQAELDTIQFMKTQLDQERLQIEREKKQMLKDHENREREIKKHENLLEIREKTLEGEIQEHVDRIRMEDEIKLLKQRKEIEIQSLQLSENQKMLEEKMKTFEQLKQDLIKQQNKFTEMEINDYDTIKTQNEVYKNEITSLQKQLKNAIVELEEQKQITASATTELGVLSVVKQEIERLMNTLNNDRVTFIQEKINLQKKLNEQQNVIHKLMERLALHDGGNIYPGQYYSSHCTGTCVTNHPRTTHQNVTKTHQLTEAERRSIYEECNLSISSDMSGESFMGVKNAKKSSNPAPSCNPQFDQWSQRLELSRRRMAQLQMVSEQFDSIYEEWKSVDLKEFLSKLNTDLPNCLTTVKSDGLTNLNELFKSDQFVTFENNRQADEITHQQTVHPESERDRNLDKEHIGSHIEINPESRSMKMKSESDIDFKIIRIPVVYVISPTDLISTHQNLTNQF